MSKLSWLIFEVNIIFRLLVRNIHTPPRDTEASQDYAVCTLVNFGC